MLQYSTYIFVFLIDCNHIYSCNFIQCIFQLNSLCFKSLTRDETPAEAGTLINIL